MLVLQIWMSCCQKLFLARMTTGSLLWLLQMKTALPVMVDRIQQQYHRDAVLKTREGSHLRGLLQEVWCRFDRKFTCGIYLAALVTKIQNS